MKKIVHLKQAFVKRIERSIKGYSDARVIFDWYVVQPLKEKTREKRVKQADTSMNFAIHNDILISKIPLKDLLSSSQTKAGLTDLFGDAVLHASMVPRRKWWL